ncbi:MAG: TetR/AcrR family transcriptional regulator, partial [Geminicoccaceae bacterium]
MSTLETDKLSPADTLCHEARDAPAESPKRIAIVEAATRLFLDSGYNVVSMDAIADAACVSKRTVYSHFNNKETLFGAVMQMMCRRFNRLDPEGGPLNGPPEEVLVTLGTGFLTLITSPEAVALYRVVTAEAPRHPKLAEVFAQNGPDPFCALLSCYFEDQTALGTLRVDQP